MSIKITSGLQLLGQIHGFHPIGRLPHHLHVRLMIQDDRQPGADNILIVGE